MEDQLKSQLEELGKQTTQFREYVERELTEVKKSGAVAPETKSALDKLTAAMDATEAKFVESKTALDNMRARLEKAEEKLGRPPAGGETKDEWQGSPEHKAWLKLVKVGDEKLTAEETKALSVSTDTAGGYLVPPQVQAGIIEMLTDFSPVRQIVNVVPISSDILHWPKQTGQASMSWTAEEATRSESTGITFGLEQIPTHEGYIYPFLTRQLIEDSSFPIESWLNEEAGRRFALGEGTAVIAGNGVGQPLGITMDPGIVSTNYTAQGEASTLTNGDGLIGLIHSMPTPYVNGAVLILNRTTLGVIRKIKGGDGHYIWWQGYNEANPPNILGVPYVEMPDMPDVGANTFPVYYGNFKRAYVMADRTQISLIRDPFSGKTAGVVQFMFYKRLGGKLVLPAAVKRLKIAAA